MEKFSIAARPGRREYSKEFKAELRAKCQEPGASIGGVAIAHGLHPNMLHRWIREGRQARALSGRIDAEQPAAFVPEGSATAKAIDYSLRRWQALIRFLDNGRLPIDNNWVENQIRPVALGRKNWLFAGSLRAGQRAAVVMSLIQSAKLNGHDPHAYLKDVMDKLPTWPNSRIEDLLPHRWSPTLV